MSTIAQQKWLEAWQGEPCFGFHSHFHLFSFTFRQRSTIKLHPHRIELQQPVRHIKGTFESTTATFIIFDISDFLRDCSRLFLFPVQAPQKILAQDQYRPSTMNFWHWLTKSTTRKALHVGNLKFSDGLQVPKNKSNTN